MNDKRANETGGLQSLGDSAVADGRKLLRLLSDGRFDELIKLEAEYYFRHIRSSETAENHSLHYSFLSPILQRYGLDLKGAMEPAPYSNAVSGRSICFFLPSLDNDYIHVELLANILNKLASQSAIKLYIAGFSISQTEIGSKFIASLSHSNRADLYMIGEDHASLLRFLDWFKSSSINLLACYSIPRLLPALLEALGPKNVTWMPTKFELDSFSKLDYVVSGFGKKFSSETIGSTTWYRIPGTLPKHYLFRYRLKPARLIRIITINREEKIRNGGYLESIISILKTDSDTHFFWTGRYWDSTIRAKFHQAGLEARHTHVGWLEHQSALPKYDIFADTFGLSGTVAAAAFASGMPTLFSRGSESWLEAVEREIISTGQDHKSDLLKNIQWCIADSAKDYAQKLTYLIDSVRAGTFDGLWQIELAERWFMNEEQQATQYESVFQQIFLAQEREPAVRVR